MQCTNRLTYYTYISIISLQASIIYIEIDLFGGFMKEKFTPHKLTACLTISDNNKKTAFTMAEVLITLGIVGIIAALTIPQLIAGYQKKETTTRLKRTYTLIQQAIQLAEQENGEFQYWDFTLSGDKFFERYLEKHFNHPIKISAIDLQQKVKRKLLNGRPYTGTTYNDSSTKIHFLTNDGSMITINLDPDPSLNNGFWIGIDTNGFANPNTVGKDTFLYFLTPEFGLQPLGNAGSPAHWSCQNCSREQLLENRSFSCNSAQSGYWCAALIMQDNWEIKKDYPW